MRLSTTRPDKSGFIWSRRKVPRVWHSIGRCCVERRVAARSIKESSADSVGVGLSSGGKKRVWVCDLKKRTDEGLVRRPYDPDAEFTSGCSELVLRGATCDATQ